MKDFHTIDDILYSIWEQIDLLGHINPDRITEGKNHIYDYDDPNFDLEASRKKLKGLGIDKRYLLGRLFEEQRLRLLNYLDLVEATGKDAEKFTQASINLYGKPSKDLMEKAYDILKKVRPDPEEPKTVSPETAKKELEKTLEDCNYHGWDVEIVKGQAAGIRVLEKRDKIFVNNNPISEAHLERGKLHEIHQHVRRYEGAKKQPYKLFRNLPGSLPTEEGLALITEKEAGLLSTNALRNCALNVIAVHLSLHGSYDEVLKELVKHSPEDTARKTLKRAKRGLKDTSQKGAFTKDYVYLQGLFDLEDYLAKGGDKDLLYTGIIGIQHLPIVKKLLNQGVLRK